MENHKSLIFEPWALGDAVIAAKLVNKFPNKYEIACQSKWNEILIELGIPAENIVNISLPYTEKHKSFLKCISLKPLQNRKKYIHVISARGDIRDYYCAHKLFPDSPKKFSGWITFFRLKIKIFDYIYGIFTKEIPNRYKMWCDIAEETIHENKIQYNLVNKKIAIHIGSSWKSRQYPFIKELKKQLEIKGWIVTILCGPGDSLINPMNIEMKNVSGKTLIEELKKASLVISNDSAPMHISSFLGLPTLALACISNIEFWKAPHVIYVSSEHMPSGVYPRKEYCSDESYPELWFSPQKVIDKIDQTFK